MMNRVSRKAKKVTALFKQRKAGNSEDAAPYRLLDSSRREIRLLVVEPGAGDQIVTCSFQYWCIDGMAKPRYETISYVWGDGNTRATIQLQGIAKDVTASSERALRRFRYTDRSRILWIDALCINQTDKEERARQVALMDEVYSNTTRNLVWLGDDNGTAAIAQDGILKLVDAIRAETDNFKNAQEVLYGGGKALRYSPSGISITLQAHEIEAILKFYSNGWFRRLWVVQEAALAQESVCYQGGVEVPLMDVLAAVSWMRHKTFHLPPPLVNAIGLLQSACTMCDICERRTGIYPNLKGRQRLVSILSDASAFETSEFRDHVFAILGLARLYCGLGGIPKLLEPDYTKSPVAVFRDAALYCIRETEDLDVLYLVRHRLNGQSLHALPTWVPSWNQPYDNAKDAYYPNTTDVLTCSKEQTMKSTDLQWSNGDQLYVTGLVVEEVQACSILMADNSVLGDILSMRLSEAVVYSFTLEDEEFQEDSLSQSGLPMTLTAGRNYLGIRWSLEGCELASTAYNELVQGNCIPDLESLDCREGWITDETLASQFRRAMYTALTNRRLYATKSGKLGLGPQPMRPGDIIVVLYGCRLPVVLRRTDSIECQYEFVGTCYLYGIMDGEAVEAHRAAGKEDVAFTLI